MAFVAKGIGSKNAVVKPVGAKTNALKLLASVRQKDSALKQAAVKTPKVQPIKPLGKKELRLATLKAAAQ
ncbi:MAG: hypothetical protein V4637_16200, partial [Pseudomonadota bacterium]